MSETVSTWVSPATPLCDKYTEADRIRRQCTCGWLIEHHQVASPFLTTKAKQDRVEMVAAMIIKLSFAVGLSVTALAVFFALIYTFLRWVLS